MKERSIAAYNTKIGLDFLEATYQITVFKALTNENKVKARSIQVLNDSIIFTALFSPNTQPRLCHCYRITPAYSMTSPK